MTLRTLCLTPARAAALLIFLGFVTGTSAFTANAQSQPGVVAIMMADGRPHFFLGGKEIDLATATAPSPAVARHAAAHLQIIAEALPPANPAAARDEDRDARQTAASQQADEVVEHSRFAFADHSPSIQHSVLPGNSNGADGATEVTTIRVCIGQPISLIRKSMGQPDRVLAQGAKTVYVYDGIKVTFTDNKVSSVD